MKRIIPVILFFLLFNEAAEARHIAGGEMSYEYLGPGSGSNLKYRITLRLYRDCFAPPNSAQLDPQAAITIYPVNSNSALRNDLVPLNRIDVISLTTPGPCIDNAPQVCYQVGYYIEDVEIPISVNGYVVTYERCCRIDNITNIVGSVNTGATYTATIPGTLNLTSAPKNTSPIFNTRDTVLICENNPFLYNFSATDIDGDDLEYQFTDAYDGASSNTPNPQLSAPPPYSPLPYAFPFSASQPMGPGITINPSTGFVSGIAPRAGIYCLTVQVIERRNGVIINRHRKDLHIKVAPCSIAAADLQPFYITCDGFTLTFQNRNNSPLIKTYFWDFGLPGSLDTSNLDRPTFTFPDTGQYRVMLITNKGIDCSDTAYTIAKVYPGFFPNFFVGDGCKNVPLQFVDQTTTQYGVVDFWRWSFGNPLINPDTSGIQNPRYSYPAIGTYQVQLIVGNSKGCRDTIDKVANVLNKPSMLVTNDTLICSIDTLQLNAVGAGTFTWFPNYMISNPNIPNPLVSPDVPTKYYVTLTSAPGCVNTDSVFVNVKTFVTLNAGPDTTICLTDTIRLNPNSDALSYRWAPTGSLNNPNIKNPIARPPGNITYTVTGNIGKCQATDAISIVTVPYPTVQTSNDTVICYGDQAQLFASGGNDYRWSPAAGLNNNRIPNPIASPVISTVYRVAVVENKGCPKPTFDSVRVRVVPPVPAFAGHDTAVVVGQPLQLNASGGTGYRWSPSSGLSNANIRNPIANLSEDAKYSVRVNTPEGCFAIDTINIRVFKTAPDIFVPTAFTPNNDHKNDFLIPIPVGISQFDYFRVYNRYGELVFSTKETGQGWDGKINGKDQGTATFVWYVKGTDYTGKVIFKKGTSTLIR